jgi:hypothetical protein
MKSQIIGNQVYSQSKSQFIQAWLVALTWNGMIIFAILKGGQQILETLESHPVFYFFVSFPLIGLWILIHAAKETIAWFKFGQTPITLDPFPGQIGGQCAGYLLLPRLNTPINQAIFSLNCIHRYAKRDAQGKTSWHEDVLWQDRASFKPEQYGNLTRVNFQFNPPAGLPATEEKSLDYHFWQCHVHIDLPGIDYDRIFILPMETISATQQDSANHYRSNTVNRIPHQQTKIAKTPTIKTDARGLTLYFGYGRAKGMALFCLITGLLIATFGYYFFSDITDIFPATTFLMAGYVGLIAFVFCLFGIFLIGNSLTLEVNLMGIVKKQRFFGFLLTTFIDADDIIDIVTEQNASSSSGHQKRVWYRLKALTKAGKEIELGDSLEGQSYANEIRQKIIDALGSRWQPANAAKTHQNWKKTKKPLPWWAKLIGKIFSYSFIIAFLYDLAKFFPELLEFLNISF